jgi:ribosomal protein S18 acetylase RimI-like enzyme
MTIRKYQTTDRDKLITLWSTIFPNPAPHNTPSVVLDAKLAVDDLIFVAEQEGVLVGMCTAGYDGLRGWLYGVGISPSARHQGTGTALVQHAIDALHALGCTKVNLQIRAGNTEVTAFYASLGFSVEERVSMGMLL